MPASVAALAQRFGLSRMEASALAGHALGKSRAWMAAHERDVLADEEAARVAALLRLRSEGQPLSYITGSREFYGLALRVTPDVLIPRPETELLVDLALARIRAAPSRRWRVLDLGTGSGAVAVAVAANAPQVEVWAVDRDPAALAVARDNAAHHGAGIRLVHSDWFSSLGEERFDLVLSNPPYVADGDRHLDQGDLRFEPRGALCGGSDGLDALRLIVAQAPRSLYSGAQLLVEHGCDQAPAVRRLFDALRWQDVRSWRDLAGHERVTGALVHGRTGG